MKYETKDSESQESNMIKYFSMFTGVGGFELGIGTLGECVGVCEWDKYASAVLAYRFPDIPNYHDATTINPKELPDFDMLVGGFPCQAFSVAGKRRGFNDTRGTLFFDIARIAQQKQPRLLVLENVKGLLSHDKGRTFHTILSTLDELGYDVEWQVLNSKNHGVPQNRERVFIIGCLRGTGGRQVFPFLGEDSSDTRQVGTDVSTCLDSNYHKGTSPGDIHKQRRQHVAAVLTPNRAEKRQNGRRMKEPEEPMFTLTGQDLHGIMVRTPEATQKGIANTLDTSQHQHTLTEDVRIRRLTPRECERLQGFPDDWTKHGMIDGEVVEMSDTQRYRMTGNAVTVNVIANIMEKLL